MAHVLPPSLSPIGTTSGAEAAGERCGAHAVGSSENGDEEHDWLFLFFKVFFISFSLLFLKVESVSHVQQAF